MDVITIFPCDITLVPTPTLNTMQTNILTDIVVDFMSVLPKPNMVQIHDIHIQSLSFPFIVSILSLYRYHRLYLYNLNYLLTRTFRRVDWSLTPEGRVWPEYYCCLPQRIPLPPGKTAQTS